MTKENLKKRIEKISKIANTYGDKALIFNSSLKEADLIIKTLEKIIEIQETFIKGFVEVRISEAERNVQPSESFLGAWLVFGKDALEKTQQLLNGGENDKRK